MDLSFANGIGCYGEQCLWREAASSLPYLSVGGAQSSRFIKRNLMAQRLHQASSPRFDLLALASSRLCLRDSGEIRYCWLDCIMHLSSMIFAWAVAYYARASAMPAHHSLPRIDASELKDSPNLTTDTEVIYTGSMNDLRKIVQFVPGGVSFNY